MQGEQNSAHNGNKSNKVLTSNAWNQNGWHTVRNKALACQGRKKGGRKEGKMGRKEGRQEGGKRGKEEMDSRLSGGANILIFGVVESHLTHFCSGLPITLDQIQGPVNPNTVREGSIQF